METLSIVCLILVKMTNAQLSGSAEAQANSLDPSVSATCSQGFMRVRLRTSSPFHGVIHARDSRDNACLTYGTGRLSTFLTINLLTPREHTAYCGVIYNNVTEESQVALAVRTHRTLELAGDNFYVITCGRSGYRDNLTNETTTVRLSLISGERRVTEAIYGREYTLQAEMGEPSDKYGIRVRNCFAFSDKNSSVRLLNDHGCPLRNVMSQFMSNSTMGIATSTLYSMFRFPDSSTVHLQCDILVCQAGQCDQSLCISSDPVIQTKSDHRQEDDNTMMASTTVFVLEPGITALATKDDCELGPSWLLWLCVVFGILFLIMLCVNMFLCSAMTCSFSRDKDMDLMDGEEKAPSVYTIQDYDPYRSWPGSQYGSRFSLDHPGTRTLGSVEPGRPLGPDHPGTRVLGGNQHHSLQSNKSTASNSRPGSRNSKYNGGIVNGGLTTSNGNLYNGGVSNGGWGGPPRPQPAIYQPSPGGHITPRSRTPVRTPRARARARHRAREAGQFDLAPDQYSLHSRPNSQTGSYRNAMRARVSEM